VEQRKAIGAEMTVKSPWLASNPSLWTLRRGKRDYYTLENAAHHLGCCVDQLAATVPLLILPSRTGGPGLQLVAVNELHLFNKQARK
jgi:hypothetical protein